MAKRQRGIQYVPTGIVGFDEITRGGLPAGRITVVLGGAGGGKTIFGAQTLAAGAREFGEPGIFVAFEEERPGLGLRQRRAPSRSRDAPAPWPGAH